MSILPIRLYPDPVLRQQTEAVTNFDRALHQLLDNMWETMLAAHGLGLAAPQVGELVKVIVIDISAERIEPPAFADATTDPDQHLNGPRLELINAEILKKEGSISSEEGCLSIPEYRDSIKRAPMVSVRAKDRQGRQFEFSATGLLGYCIQHEIDHTNGVLFIDHLSRLKRSLFNRWLRKQEGRDE